MKISFRASVVIDLADPAVEPTIEMLVELVNQGKVKLSLPDLFTDPVLTFTDQLKGYPR